MNTHETAAAAAARAAKERPIPFSGAMVRALLNDTKTQTRRVYKPRKHPDMGCQMAAHELVREPQHVIDRACPYGQPGDRLWVREATLKVEEHGWVGPVYVESDAGRNALEWGYGESDDPDFIEPYELKTRPPMFMPRAAARLLLEIVSVRVERLQAISEADAIAEGIEGCGVVINGRSQGTTWRDYGSRCEDPCEWFSSPLDSYRSLWASINGAGSWDANPWVWVVEFKRLQAGAEGA
jgi:hypothetical protein